MEPFKKLVSYEEAIKIVLDNVRAVEKVEIVGLADSHDRVLARDLVAENPVPPFARAAMDGYAVKAEDTYGSSMFKPKTVKLIGAIYPGEPFAAEVKHGECIQIATGCPIPRGADAVVMVEFTKEEGEHIQVQRPVYPGSNIAPKGEDIESGALVLDKGTHLTPSKVGVLAALGLTAVEVYERPKVSILSTGKEVKEVGSQLKEGEVYDINTYTLFSIAKANGATPFRFNIVPDSEIELRTAIQHAMENDLVILSGGSSVGTRDLLYRVVEDLGSVIFHGVQVKPGKPTLFGLIEGKPIFGMPGYPTSCLSNAYMFLVPALRKMARLPQKDSRTIKVPMGHRFVSSSGRVQFLTVKIRDGKAYQAFKESGAITSMSGADGYILVPLSVDVLEEGEEVTVTFLE